MLTWEQSTVSCRRLHRVVIIKLAVKSVLEMRMLDLVIWIRG